MMHEFKKTGVAAAVAGALLAVSGGAQAVTPFSQNEVILSAPDDVMLVPHVICDRNAEGGQINTLVGIKTIFPNRPALTRLGDFRAERHTAKPTSGVFTGRLHWRFYNTRSVHIIDGVIDVTDNDFVRFDWCNVASKLSSLNGQPGYLLFHADSLRLNTDRNIWLGVGTTPANNATYLECALAPEGCPKATWESIRAGGAVFDTSALTARGTAGNLGFERRIWLYGSAYLIQGNWESQ
ncbi:MAG: hypothetical protein R6X17_15120, partial [Candidatus Competibacteraceae bacterium]